MPVLSPPIHHNGSSYPTPRNYGAPTPQPGPPMAPGFVYQPNFYSPQGSGGHPANGPIPLSTPVPMSFHDQAELARKMRDYESLTQIITQWNANRLDLFALSLPNEVRLNQSSSAT